MHDEKERARVSMRGEEQNAHAPSRLSVVVRRTFYALLVCAVVAAVICRNLNLHPLAGIR